MSPPVNCWRGEKAIFEWGTKFDICRKEKKVEGIVFAHLAHERNDTLSDYSLKGGYIYNFLNGGLERPVKKHSFIEMLEPFVEKTGCMQIIP